MKKPSIKEIKEARRTLDRIAADSSIADQFTEEEIEQLEWVVGQGENKRISEATSAATLYSPYVVRYGSEGFGPK